jgi:hypothetical protein
MARSPQQPEPLELAGAATAGDALRDNRGMKTLILVLAVVALGACRQEGPAEKAGRNIDQAGKDVARSVDKAGENLRDATKAKK